MSLIRVDNFGPSAGGTTYSARGIAKAWVHWNGTGTISIKDSENTSSLVDLGTGVAEINISSAFDAVQYTGSAFAASGVISNSYYEAMFYCKNTGTYFQRNHWQGTDYDLAYAGSHAFGDLA